MTAKLKWKYMMYRQLDSFQCDTGNAVNSSDVDFAEGRG